MRHPFGSDRGNGGALEDMGVRECGKTGQSAPALAQANPIIYRRNMMMMSGSPCQQPRSNPPYLVELHVCIVLGQYSNFEFAEIH
jgi:hypothetical protein